MLPIYKKFFSWNSNAEEKIYKNLLLMRRKNHQIHTLIGKKVILNGDKYDCVFGHLEYFRDVKFVFMNENVVKNSTCRIKMENKMFLKFD